jgi:two-component system cell cycle response regulator CtrA
MKILLIEDDGATARSIATILAGAGHACDTADLGASGLESAMANDYDIIVLDIMLPDMEGFEVLSRLRAGAVSTPVLVLSGQSQPDEKVRALSGGADDYLTKPYDKGELIARVEAVLRRSRRNSESVVRVGPLSINLDKRTLEVAGQAVHLTVKEFSTLELLAQRRGTTLSKEAILTHLYSGIDVPELKIIDVFVCKLRRKLADATGDGQNLIQTVWGCGYALREVEDDGGLSRAA